MPGETPRTERKTGALFASPFRFRKYGQSGLEVSELFPHVAQHADELCVIRSMYADVPNHEPSLLLMNTGEARLVRPSMGSWLTYGLGTDNQNLPAFVAMCPGGYPIQESQNWQAGFLPGVYQGTYIDTQHESIDKLIENVCPTSGLDWSINVDSSIYYRTSIDFIKPPGRRFATRIAHSVLRAGLSHADGSRRGLRRVSRTAIRARCLRSRRASPAATDRASFAGTRRALRSSLARCGSAVGQP